MFCLRCGEVLSYLLSFGRTLSWFFTAEHVGNTLYHSGSMDLDCYIHSTQFINMSIEVMKEIHFARPAEVL